MAGSDWEFSDTIEDWKPGGLRLGRPKRMLAFMMPEG